MKSVRIEVATREKGPVLLVDVECDCRRNYLRDKETGVMSNKHPVPVKGFGQKTLICDCGREIILASQNSHVHIRDKGTN